jgi:hypothetical protein
VVESVEEEDMSSEASFYYSAQSKAIVENQATPMVELSKRDFIPPFDPFITQSVPTGYWVNFILP